MMKTIIKAKWASHKGVQAALKSSLWLCPLVPSPGNSALLGALYILLIPSMEALEVTEKASWPGLLLSG